jgi:hypothetical protein
LATLRVCLTHVSDPEVVTYRLATEAAEYGKAIAGGERQRAMLLQAKVDAVLAELGRRGADVDAILAGLLGSDDAGVRFTAASKLLRLRRLLMKCGLS